MLKNNGCHGYLMTSSQTIYIFCFDILVGNRIDNELNPGFYVKIKFRGIIMR